MDSPEQDQDETPAEIVRRARGQLSLDRFAGDLGTSRQRVIAWEKGRSVPSERYAAAIAERAGVPVDRVLRSASSETLSGAMADIKTMLAELAQLAQERGYLPADAEEEPARSSDLASIARRLRALEATVEAQGAATTTALKALTAGIRRLERRLDAGDPPATSTAVERR